MIEIAAVAECYLMITHIKNKDSKKQPFPICISVKLTDGRKSIKKEKNSLYLIYNIVSLGKMAEKTEPFS